MANSSKDSRDKFRRIQKNAKENHIFLGCWLQAETGKPSYEHNAQSRAFYVLNFLIRFPTQCS